ncbi:Zinc finger CCHC domain-containing protein 9, partial [Caligus rogercresseyi]
MTRYARSKGSKASNEREPEEATPWNEMVQSVKKVSSFNPEDEDGETYENSEDGSADEEGLAMEVDEAPEDSTVAPSNTAPSEENESELLGKKKKKKRNQNKCLNCKEKGHLKKECPQLSEERRKELQELYVMKVERKGMGTGRKKNKRADKENPLSEPGFRVKTEDVPRLKQLEKDLRLAVKEKKIMNKELEETLKKERRRAENELA